jgi:hypothetical protein
MVRRIVGVLVEIGRGALDPHAAAALFTSSGGEAARLTAPASRSLPRARVLQELRARRSYRAGDADSSALSPTRVPRTRRTTCA